MERLAGNTSLLDRKAYEYIPRDVYATVLESLTKLHPPKFNGTLDFMVRVVLGCHMLEIGVLHCDTRNDALLLLWFVSRSLRLCHL